MAARNHASDAIGVGGNDNGDPVDASNSYPLAAQIPLESFDLPHFPPEASHLRELTLTADIKLDEYQTLVHGAPNTAQSSTNSGRSNSWPGFNLPASITHLNLELFHLGFPGSANWLEKLAKGLPNLQSLTLFSCLIDGISSESRSDATVFFAHLAPNLKELHIIDTFARPGFWIHVAKIFAQQDLPAYSGSAPTTASQPNSALAPTTADDEAAHSGLKILNVTYTFRGHGQSNTDFLARVNGEEWVFFLSSSLAGISFNLIPPVSSAVADDTTKPDPSEFEKSDLDNQGKGILPYASDSRVVEALRTALKSIRLSEVRILNLSMFTMRVRPGPSNLESGLHHDWRTLLSACESEDHGKSELADLTVSLLIEDAWWDTLIETMNDMNGAVRSLEALEIVGVPFQEKDESREIVEGLIRNEKGVNQLAAVCPKLSRFEMNILRAQNIDQSLWVKDPKTGTWSVSDATSAGA